MELSFTISDYIRWLEETGRLDPSAGPGILYINKNANLVNTNNENFYPLKVIVKNGKITLSNRKVGGFGHN